MIPTNMRYVDFRGSIAAALRKNTSGLTWQQLRTRLKLPYDRACPNWVSRLEEDIGLTRKKGDERSLIWTLKRVKAANLR